jgi:diacylglycerol O-acyltransferase
MTGTSPEPLSPDDAAILALESDAVAGHTLKLIVFEPGEEPLDVEMLRASVAERLAGEPRALQRVELDAEGSPIWVTDADFDIAAQVRSREGAEGGDETAMWAVAGELMSERLDHRRPLWALDLLGPLADGRQAIVARIHHAMADGISSVRFLAGVLWDSEQAAAPGHLASRRDEEKRSLGSELRHLPGAIRRELGGHASRSPLDRPIGSARELAFTTVPLAELKRIGASRPGHVTVNDVLLAGIAGGLRSWLGSENGEALPALRAQIPVSLHHRSEGEGELGNRDSS